VSRLTWQPLSPRVTAALTATPIVYVLDVAHDDTCPTLARLEGDAR
jgi:hypothetical protein